jgi:hypothetical protein
MASTASSSCLDSWPYSRPVDVSTLAGELDRLAEKHSHPVIQHALAGWLNTESAQRSRAGWDAAGNLTNTIENHIALAHKSMKEEADEMAEELATYLPNWWPEQNLPKANPPVLAATILPLVEQHGWALVNVGVDLWLEDKGGQGCKNPFGLFCSQIAYYIGLAQGGRRPIITAETRDDDEDEEADDNEDDHEDEGAAGNADVE